MRNDVGLWLVPWALLVLLSIAVGLLSIFLAIAGFVAFTHGQKFQTEDWIGFVVAPLAGLGLSAGFFWLGRRIGRTRSGPVRQSTVTVECPQCKADVLVRGNSAAPLLSFGMRYSARCLTCGSRFEVPAETWKSLAWPEVGDPYETVSDKFDRARHTDMTPGQIVCSIAGTIAGFAAMGYLIVRDAPFVLAGLVFFGLLYGGWGIGYLLFPPPRKPGQRCVKCGFDLRSCTEPRCTECGTPFDPRQVRIRMLGTPAVPPDDKR